MENSIFLSYRRTSIYTARAVFQALKAEGFDVFLDYHSIDNGAFERIILAQVRVRAHFLLILTPSTLERCTDPDDWVRREIEAAMDAKRNIVPLMFDDFDFQRHGTPYLNGPLARLPEYNALRIHADYFEEGMTRLVSRFLQKPPEDTLHPEGRTPEPDLTALVEAEKYYEQARLAVQEDDDSRALHLFTEAIRLNPQYSYAYYERGMVQRRIDFTAAEQDFSAALELYPRYHQAYYQRAELYNIQGDWPAAIHDYTAAIRIYPPYMDAYFGRGVAHARMENYKQALADFEEVARLVPDYPFLRENLAQMRRKLSPAPFRRLLGKGETDAPTTPEDFIAQAVARPRTDSNGRLEDFNQAIARKPGTVWPYFYRAAERYDTGAFAAALRDIEHALTMEPDMPTLLVNQAEYLLALKRYDEALARYQEILKRDPAQPHSRAGIALAYFGLGQIEEAKTRWRALIEQNSEYRYASQVRHMLHWHEQLVLQARQLIALLE